MAQQALDQLANATGIDFNAVAKSGKKLSGNALALDLLKNQLGEQGKHVRYYAAGDQAELPPELAGLAAEILGPPPKDSQAFLWWRKLSARNKRSLYSVVKLIQCRLIAAAPFEQQPRDLTG